MVYLALYPIYNSGQKNIAYVRILAQDKHMVVSFWNILPASSDFQFRKQGKDLYGR